MKETILTIGGIILALFIVANIFLGTFEDAADSAADYVETQMGTILKFNPDNN